MIDKNVQRASVLDTATLSDALDKLGIAGQCLGIKPRDHLFRMTGRAYTLKYGPFDPDNPGTVGDYIDDLAPGSVVAIDNDSREDATVWGDILTFIAHNNGVAGTVIDGPCRDVHLCIELGYPVFSRSYSMRTGKDRVQLVAEQESVSIGSVTVNPGDLMRGDSDGVVAIPQDRETEVLQTAEAIEVAEEAIRTELRAGSRLDEARRKLGYHKLQTPDE